VTCLAIIDHGAGNLVSIERALTLAGADTRIVDAPEGLHDADAIVVPGVGATGAAMERLGQRRLVEPLRAWDGPLLGICVGMQVMFDRSDEDKGPCLGLVPGSVKALTGRPLPHMGWNDVATAGDPIFDGVPSGSLFTFVHSYAAVPDDPGVVTAVSNHGGPFVAAVRNGNRVGLQFHPERSSAAGLRVLTNFVEEVGRVA